LALELLAVDLADVELSAAFTQTVLNYKRTLYGVGLGFHMELNAAFAVSLIFTAVP